MPQDLAPKRLHGRRAATVALGLVLAAGVPRALLAQDAPATALPTSAQTPTGQTASRSPEPAASDKPGAAGAPMTMETFLDRLMIAESGGRLDARNPRSTAVGPFQFIESTFLAVVRRHFAAETATLAPHEILALRSHPVFARKAAEAYTRDNAAVLQGFDVAPTFPHLRLAFLLGPGGAARVLKAPPDAPLAGLLAPAVLVANPFMASLTAAGLVARSAREVAQPVTSTAGVAVPPGTTLAAGAGGRRALPPGIAVRCNLRLPSCKRWLALTTAKARHASPAPTRVAFARGVVPETLAPAPAEKTRRAAAPKGLAGLGRRVSPTMEAAARGIPLATRPAGLGARLRQIKAKRARR